MKTVKCFAYIAAFALLILVAVCAFKPGLISHIKTCFAEPAPPPELSHGFYESVGFHQKIDQNLPAGSILFIGDSHVQGLAVTAVTPLGVNFGIGHDTTLGVLHRLPLYSSVKETRAVVLAIGFNDLRRRNNAAIIKNISQILEQIPPGVPVLLCGIMPVDEEPRNLAGYNARILLLNEQLAHLEALRSKTLFLNPTPILANKTGSLPSTLHSGDGIHLNSPGYERWIAALVGGLAALGSME